MKVANIWYMVHLTIESMVRQSPRERLEKVSISRFFMRFCKEGSDGGSWSAVLARESGMNQQRVRFFLAFCVSLFLLETSRLMMKL